MAAPRCGDLHLFGYFGIRRARLRRSARW